MSAKAYQDLKSLKSLKMTTEERNYTTEHLNATANETMKAIEGLSAEQLKFKPSTESWSVEECMKHIMLAEINIWGGFVDAPMATEPDASRRSEVTMTDAQVTGIMEVGSDKIVTLEYFDPKLRPEAVEVTIKEFKDLRDEHLDWTKKIDGDLRNHYAETPFGVIDVYQAINFISVHTGRHAVQIKNIIANANFPSN
ncbi:MAG: DinB family protein [Reichenbachiella sp.]